MNHGRRWFGRVSGIIPAERFRWACFSVTTKNHARRPAPVSPCRPVQAGKIGRGGFFLPFAGGWSAGVNSV